MQITKCDSCKCEIGNSEKQFTISKLVFSWHETYWIKLDLCSECFMGLKTIWLNKK